MNAPTQKELFKELKTHYKQGMLKTEAFKNYQEKGGDLITGASYLASVPDQNMPPNLKFLNQVLLALFFLPQLAKIMSGVSEGTTSLFMLLFWPALVLYFAIEKKVLYFLFIGYVTFRDLMRFITSLDSGQTVEFSIFAFSVIALALCVYLKLKIYPYQNLFHTRKTTNGLIAFTNESNS